MSLINSFGSFCNQDLLYQSVLYTSQLVLRGVLSALVLLDSIPSDLFCLLFERVFVQSLSAFINGVFDEILVSLRFVTLYGTATEVAEEYNRVPLLD